MRVDVSSLADSNNLDINALLDEQISKRFDTSSNHMDQANTIQEQTTRADK